MLTGSLFNVNAQVANQPDDLIRCQVVFTGIAIFDLNQTLPQILGSQDPAFFDVTFYETQLDADNGVNAIGNSSEYINSSNPFTVFVRLEELATGSFDTTQFELIVFPAPEDFGPFELRACDDEINGSTSTDEISTFNLTSLNNQMTGGDPNLEVIFYATLDDLQNDIPIVDPTLYQNVANPQAIYVRINDTTSVCFSDTTLTLLVMPNPSAVNPTPLEVCDDNGDGFAEFNLTDKDLEIVAGDPDVTVRYFETLSNAANGVNPLVSPYINIVPLIQIVYARAENNDSNCFTIVELELIVLDGCPDIASPPEDIFVNEGDDNGWARFDLTVNESLMLGTQDPNVFLFSYHTSLEDAGQDINAISNPISYRNIANPQEIYVRFYNSTSNGYVLAPFEIETDGVLGIDQNFSINFSVYPNPASGIVVIQSNEIFPNLEITLFDMNGRLLYSESNVASSNRLQFDVSNLASGMYLLQINSEEKTTVKQLVKQ